MEIKYTGELNCRIRELCEAFQEHSVSIECGRERDEVRDELHGLCLQAWKARDISRPQLLLALMDAYEVTRDEGMLQEVLDVAGRRAGSWEPSPDGVRLLCYCYYYTEDEECGELARGMLEKLRGNEEGYAEVLEVFREMVGKF